MAGITSPGTAYLGHLADLHQHISEPLIPLSVILQDAKSAVAQGVESQQQKPRTQPASVDTLLIEDLTHVRHTSFLGKTPAEPGEQPVYVAIAGAPGAGKSTLLEQVLDRGAFLAPNASQRVTRGAWLARILERCWPHRESLPDESMPLLDQQHAHSDARYAKTVLADPDRVFLVHSLLYHDHLAAATMAQLGPEKAKREAYEKSRARSNAGTNTIRNQIVADRYHFADGSTLTGGQTGRYLHGLQQRGYDIHLGLCHTSRAVQRASLQRREQKEGFVQVAAEDVEAKARLFIERHKVYAQYSTMLALFWRPRADADAVLGAIYKDGKKTVYDVSAYKAYIASYNAARADLVRPRRSLLARLCYGAQPPMPTTAPTWKEFEDILTTTHS